MSQTNAYNENLTGMILDLKKEVTQCKECFRFFNLPAGHASQGEAGRRDICDICENKHTDPTLLMVVEKDSDLESMRKSRVYSGKYFVLGGLVPIVEKNTKRKIRIEELKKKIQASEESSKRGLPSLASLKEIILAFSLTPQGNHTDLYVRGELEPLTAKQKIKVTSLGRGLSTGTELEYSDNDTLKNALKNRQ
jgi:recombination protein RecR